MKNTSSKTALLGAAYFGAFNIVNPVSNLTKAKIGV